MKSDFKAGDIVLFKNKDWFAWFIQRYNYLKYGESGPTHVGIIGKVKQDNVVIYEAFNNFIATDYEKWWIKMRMAKGTIQIRRSKKQLTYVKNHCDKYLGKKYGYFDILLILLTFFTRFKFIRFTGSKRVICSEAVSRLLYDSSNKKLNLATEFNKPYDFITPMDIKHSTQLKNV